MGNRISGMIQFQIDGEVMDAKGDFTFGYGVPKRTAITSTNGTVGYKEEPAIPFVEGMIIDRGTVDLPTLFRTDSATVTLTLGNGKLFALHEAWFAGDGEGSSDEGTVKVRFEGKDAEEIKA